MVETLCYKPEGCVYLLVEFVRFFFPATLLPRTKPIYESKPYNFLFKLLTEELEFLRKIGFERLVVTTMCEKMLDVLCMSDDIKRLDGVSAIPAIVQKELSF